MLAPAKATEGEGAGEGEGEGEGEGGSHVWAGEKEGERALAHSLGSVKEQLLLLFSLFLSSFLPSFLLSSLSFPLCSAHSTRKERESTSSSSSSFFLFQAIRAQSVLSSAEKVSLSLFGRVIGKRPPGGARREKEKSSPNPQGRVGGAEQRSAGRRERE